MVHVSDAKTSQSGSSPPWSMRDPTGTPLGDDPGRGQRIPVGTVLAGKYEVGEPIGRGSGSTVYGATQRPMGREVAIKVASASQSDPVARARFVREARFLAAIDHPNVVRVYELGWLENGAAAIAMERLRGETLQQRLDRGGPTDVAEAVALVRPLLDALTEVHGQGIVHRDLKPSNVFLVAGVTRGSYVPKLLDFGIGKDLADASEPLTAAGRFVGTPAFLAPEQMRPKATVDARADLYTVGVLLFRMLSGRLPFVAPGARVIFQVLGEPAPRLSSLRADVPAAMDELVAKALAKDPAQRHQTAEELRDALVRALG
jgi:serine/threonine-protein kinase